MNINKHISVYKGLPRDIYLLFVSTVINKMGSFIMPLLTLILTEQIGFTKTQAGLFTTISMLTQAPFLMIGGNLVDKFGSKKIIVIFQVMGSIFYVVCGFMKPNFTVAVLIIIASNLYALASPAFNAMVPIVTPQKLMKNAYSLMYLGLNLGLAIGPIIGGILYYKNLLNILFILDAVTTLLSTLLIALFIKANVKDCDSKVQLEEQEVNSKNSNSIFSFLCKNPALVVFSVILLIYNFCYIQWNFMLPLQTIDLFSDKGKLLFPILFSVNAITVILVTPFLTSITQKTSPIKSIFWGGILYFISFTMFGVSRFMFVFVIGIIVMTMGEILISINSNNYIAQRTPKEFLGRANSILFLVNGTGYAIGPYVMGVIIMYVSFQNAWFLVAGLMLIGAVAMYMVKKYDKN
jgi:MFS family permease